MRAAVAVAAARPAPAAAEAAALKGAGPVVEGAVDIVPSRDRDFLPDKALYSINTSKRQR